MIRNTLLVDLAVALAITILVLILAPGLAVVAILAVAVLVVCGVSFGVTRWRRRGARSGSRRSPTGVDVESASRRRTSVRR